MKASVKQHAIALYELLTEDGADVAAISQAFIQRLHTEGRLKELTEIVRAVEEVDYTARGVTPVTVRTAHEQDKSEMAKIVAELMDAQNVEVSAVVEPELLGGIQIETTNSRWDLSARGQLRSLATSIKN